MMNKEGDETKAVADLLGSLQTTFECRLVFASMFEQFLLFLCDVGVINNRLYMFVASYGHYFSWLYIVLPKFLNQMLPSDLGFFQILRPLPQFSTEVAKKPLIILFRSKWSYPRSKTKRGQLHLRTRSDVFQHRAGK